jgi:hypothetical protein
MKTMKIITPTKRYGTKGVINPYKIGKTLKPMVSAARPNRVAPTPPITVSRTASYPLPFKRSL